MTVGVVSQVVDGKTEDLRKRMVGHGIMFAVDGRNSLLSATHLPSIFLAPTKKNWRQKESESWGVRARDEAGLDATLKAALLVEPQR